MQQELYDEYLLEQRLLTQAASHYYATMTKHDRMPLLVGQEI
jgi:hypothetical protein